MKHENNREFVTVPIMPSEIELILCYPGFLGRLLEGGEICHSGSCQTHVRNFLNDVRLTAV